VAFGKWHRLAQPALVMLAAGILVWFWSRSIAPWRRSQAISQAALTLLAYCCWADLSLPELRRFQGSRFPSVGVLMVVAMVFSSISTTLPFRQTFARPSNPQEFAFDVMGANSSSLDIVVSMYAEPIHKANRLLQHLESLPILARRNISIFIYAKRPIKDLGGLLDNISSETVLTELPNVGREAATYLHHIIDRLARNTPADHTLFIQAELHNEQGFFRHLEQHLIPPKQNPSYPG
jgi:hypothetical protein